VCVNEHHMTGSARGLAVYFHLRARCPNPGAECVRACGHEESRTVMIPPCGRGTTVQDGRHGCRVRGTACRSGGTRILGPPRGRRTFTWQLVGLLVATTSLANGNRKTTRSSSLPVSARGMELGDLFITTLVLTSDNACPLKLGTAPAQCRTPD